MNELAHRYASALYGLYSDEERLRETSDRLQNIPALWESLISPAVCSDEKQRVLARCLTDLSDAPELLRFFQLLAVKGRISLLPDIVKEFHELNLRQNNAAECVMTCVRLPDSASQERIKALLCKLHRKSEVHLTLRTDPALLGGFILDIEGVTYDQSVRGRLRSLARHLEEVDTV